MYSCIFVVHTSAWDIITDWFHWILLSSSKPYFVWHSMQVILSLTHSSFTMNKWFCFHSFMIICIIISSYLHHCNILNEKCVIIYDNRSFVCRMIYYSNCCYTDWHQVMSLYHHLLYSLYNCNFKTILSQCVCLCSILSSNQELVHFKLIKAYISATVLSRFFWWTKTSK
jgi:hypothetical protein